MSIFSLPYKRHKDIQIEQKMNISQSELIYLDYESTIYCYNQKSMDMFEMANPQNEIFNSDRFSRILSHGSVIPKDEALNRIH